MTPRSAQNRQPADRDRPIYVLVRPELTELHQTLARHFADDPGVEVMLARRQRPRRTGRERRRVSKPPPNGVERRLAPGLEGRRLAERRHPVLPVEEPPVPPELRAVAG